MKPEFIVFSLGDSRQPSTWSNVPFFFTRTLERRGHQVHHVNIGPPRFLQVLFDVPWKTFCRLVGRQTRFTYVRSGLNRRVVEGKVNRALKRFPEGHCVFTTFSFGAGDKRPYTLFCDQTFEQHIVYFDERSPDGLERPTILEERMNLRKADLIIALFPELADTLRALHGHKVKYYGNVVNMDIQHVDEEELLKLKRMSKEIVFIGNRRYKEGLERLAEAIEVLNAKGSNDLIVNVIGMDRRELPSAPRNMKFHGYLDKGVPAQKLRYNDIMERSRLFVNPNPKWAAFSASCEALFLYTPVVIFPYREFESTFGDVNQVGHPLDSTEPLALATVIANLMEDDEAWTQKAVAAHNATRKMTWDNYITQYLHDLKEHGRA